MPLTAKKVDYIFEKPIDLDIIVASAAVSRKNRAKLKKLFNLNTRLRWGVQYSRHTEYTHYFLISNCSNASDFLK